MQEYILVFFFFFKQKTAYEMRISDWSSDVCSSDLRVPATLQYLFKERPQMLLGVGLAAERFQAAHGMGRHPAITLGVVFGHVIAGEIGRASCRERVCQYV